MTTDPDLPLSAAQLGLWLDLQLRPDNPERYNIATCAEIDEAFDPLVFEEAARQVIRQTVALRTEFFLDGTAEPRQRFVEPGRPVIEYANAGMDTDEAARQWMSEDLKKPFDLFHAPLFRFVLIRVQGTRWYWYAKYHHLIIDGYGLAIVRQRIAAACQASNSGLPLATIEKYGYIDYLESERAYRQSAQCAEDRQYWLQQHCNSTGTSISEPRSRTSSELNVHRSDNLIEPEIGKALGELANTLNIELSHLIVAVVTLYLHRHTGASEVSVGLPTHGRIGMEQRELVGLCANILPLRIPVDSRLTFPQFARRVSEHVSEATRHQRYRYEEICRDLRISSDDSGLFSTLVNVIIVRDGMEFSLGNARARISILAAGPVHGTSFLFYGRRETREITARVEANPAACDEWHLDALRLHFRQMMSHLVSQSSLPLAQYILLTKEQRQQLVLDWSGASSSTFFERCFHQLFEMRATQTPNCVALSRARQQLTYDELNRRANQVAHLLISHGLAADDIVAIYMHRSFEAIISLLGVLKAGAAYLPIEPDTPAGRVRHMIQDTQPAFLLTVTELIDTAREFDALLACAAVDNSELLAAFHQDNPELPVRPTDLAYVIYTSGSTGQPKGAQIEHAGLSNLVHAQCAAFGVERGSRVLQLARLGFDASLSEIGMALTAGATLYLMPATSPQSITDLPAVLAQERITIATIPPAVLARIADDNFSELSTIVVAGEQCPVALASKWATGRRLINAYGPTEASVCATYAVFDASSSVLPIGRPIANVRVYLLNADQELVPAGMPGEICIGGVGVARGYLGQPELTAQKFIPDPFADRAGCRLYRTGDFGRWLADGNIEFLGRADTQVKVRGCRVELGEVEAALLRHESVDQCVAITQSRSGTLSLTAYVVAVGNGNLTPEELRSFLRTELPDFMVPSSITLVREIPLTLNGKVDRKALAALSVSAPNQSTPETLTDVERRLMSIFAEMLQTTQIGLHAPFFDMGGDSLLAISTILSIRDEFAVEFAADRFFLNPSVAAVAEEISQLLSQTESTHVHQQYDNAWARFFA